MDFADKVKYVRETLMISQAKLAELLGVSFATVNRWETGKLEATFLNERKFEKLCKENYITFKENNNE